MTNPMKSNDTVVPDDPWGLIKQEAGPSGVSPRAVAAFHARDDVDSSQTAHHHTIGIKHDQGAAGDHVHDGSSSRKIGANMGLSVTGSRGGNVALTNLIAMLKNVIEFTDTTS